MDSKFLNNNNNSMMMKKSSPQTLLSSSNNSIMKVSMLSNNAIATTTSATAASVNIFQNNSHTGLNDLVDENNNNQNQIMMNNNFDSSGVSNPMFTSTQHSYRSIPMNNQVNMEKPKLKTHLGMSDLQVAMEENRRLAGIARICIHLIDRCRKLNKSKRFTEDLSKLSTMIDDYNRIKKNFPLPSLNSSGFFSNDPTTTNSNFNKTIQSSMKTVGCSSGMMTILNNDDLNSDNGKVFLIPIGTIGPQKQSIGEQQFQLINISSEAPSANNKSSSKVLKSSRSKNKKTLSDCSLTIKSNQNPNQRFFSTNESSSIPLMNAIQDQNSLISLIQTPSSMIDLNSNIGELVAKQENDGSDLTLQNHKMFKCLVCEKTFVNTYNLNRHLKSHTRFQAYPCQYCHKRFNYSYHLKRHIETHTGARPFACTWPGCVQRFNRKYNLNRHLWIHTENKHPSKS